MLNRNIKLPFSAVYPEQLCENELNTHLTHTWSGELEIV